jgi:subtilisin family serine protease
VDATHEFLDEAKVIAEACYSSALPEWSVSSVCPNGESEQEGPGSGQHCSSDIDGCDHGTHVAGIVAGNAAGTHQAAFSGVATEADIIALQVFSRVDDPITCAEFRRPTPCALTSTSDMMRALEYVYDLRDTFRIAAVNLSLGGGKFTHHCDGDDPMAALIDKLRLAGIATIAASGNHGFTDGLSDPACISSTISVGSTTKRDVVSGFSNSAPFLSLVAPGEHIHSATPANGMSVKSGTSMAAPHVAGAFAVLRQASPDATVDELLRVLQTTGVPIVDWRNGVIVPRLDVGAALDVLLLR